MPDSRLPVSAAWSRLLAPALAGDAQAALSVITQDRPPGDWQVVAARALWALGHDEAAAATLERAPAGPTRDALACVALARPGAALVRRLHAPRASTRADAACDLAWRALRDGKQRHAREAIAIALGAGPHHAEARRWDRFLSQARDPVGAVRRASEDRPPCSRADRDARALCPTRRGGWLSPERWWRRVEAGTWTRPAHPASALGRLQRDGVVSRVLATEADYGRLPAPHRLVDAERALDAARALEREGRDPSPAAEEAWALAARVDATAVADCSAALVALSVRAPSAATVGLAAAELLCRTQPAVPAWAAYRARLLAYSGRRDEARAAARRLADMAARAPSQLDPVSLGLTLVTLRSTGAKAAAERLGRDAHGDPRLRPVVEHVRAHPERPLVPVVGDRLRSRLPPAPLRSAG